MNKLEKLAKRIGEIGAEIREHKSQREINLEKCAGSEDEDFERSLCTPTKYEPFENCLTNAFEWVKADREEGMNISFDEVINMYGCANCIGAYKANQKIGLLKQERGRLVRIYQQ